MIVDVSDIAINKLKTVPLSYYKENRTRLIEGLVKMAADEESKTTVNGVVFMKGHIEHMINKDSDASVNWKHEPNFRMLFGFRNIMNLYAFIDVASGETVVAIPRVSEEDQVFDKVLTVENSDPAEFGVDRFIY